MGTKVKGQVVVNAVVDPVLRRREAQTTKQPVKKRRRPAGEGVGGPVPWACVVDVAGSMGTHANGQHTAADGIMNAVQAPASGRNAQRSQE